MTTLTPYEIILRAFDDKEFRESLHTDLQGTLVQYGITNPKEINELSTILGLISSGASQTQKMLELTNGTLDVAEDMQKGLKETLKQIDSAYRSTMHMYQISFYLGILLIIVAVGAALLGREPLLPSVFGTLGTANTLAFFLLKPQERLQASRASLAQIQAAMYNWFVDSVSLYTLKNAYMKRDDLATAATMSEVGMQHTEKTLDMLQRYCKLSSERLTETVAK
jgi:DNA-binding ferritin-like protein (Dps family)